MDQLSTQRKRLVQTINRWMNHWLAIRRRPYSWVSHPRSNLVFVREGVGQEETRGKQTNEDQRYRVLVCVWWIYACAEAKLKITRIVEAVNVMCQTENRRKAASVFTCSPGRLQVVSSISITSKKSIDQVEQTKGNLRRDNFVSKPTVDTSARYRSSLWSVGSY